MDEQWDEILWDEIFCFFSYEIFRKQFFSNDSFSNKIIEWENQGLVSVECGEYSSDNIISVMEPLDVNEFCVHASLVHLMGFSKVWRRFNVLTLRESDVTWLLEIKDKLTKSAWTKRYYSENFINNKFLNAYLSQNERPLYDSVKEDEKNQLVLFLMSDIFNLCKKSAEYLSDCLIECKAPDIDLWFGFKFPFSGENVLYMHCIDKNLLTHSGKMMLQMMVSLDDVISFLERGKRT